MAGTAHRAGLDDIRSAPSPASLPTVGADVLLLANRALPGAMHAIDRCPGRALPRRTRQRQRTRRRDPRPWWTSCCRAFKHFKPCIQAQPTFQVAVLRRLTMPLLAIDGVATRCSTRVRPGGVWRPQCHTQRCTCPLGPVIGCRTDRSTVDPAQTPRRKRGTGQGPERFPCSLTSRSTKEEPNSVAAASPQLPRSTPPWPPGRTSIYPPVSSPSRPTPGWVRTAPGPYPPDWSR